MKVSRLFKEFQHKFWIFPAENSFTLNQQHASINTTKQTNYHNMLINNLMLKSVYNFFTIAILDLNN